MGKPWWGISAVGKPTAKKVKTLTKPDRYSDDDGSGFCVPVDDQVAEEA